MCVCVYILEIDNRENYENVGYNNCDTPLAGLVMQLKLKLPDLSCCAGSPREFKLVTLLRLPTPTC
jgi:hypothetical protein